MRLPRFTTRRLMVLVAVAGLILGAVDWGRLRRPGDVGGRGMAPGRTRHPA